MSQATKPDSRQPCEVAPNPLVDDLSPKHLRRGVLIPLKTTQEVRQDHVIVQAWITRAPTKQTNDVITFVDPRFPDYSLPLTHLQSPTEYAT
jgi:tRNA-specific adenosine deaminase 3